jgi:hypothetical protein
VDGHKVRYGNGLVAYPGQFAKKFVAFQVALTSYTNSRLSGKITGCGEQNGVSAHLFRIVLKQALILSLQVFFILWARISSTLAASP